LPFSLIVLGLVGLVTLLDLYQTWNVYLILQNQTYTASATQRLRVVLTWAIPFVFLTNITMIANNEFSVLSTVPLIALPIVIFLAHKPEGTFLGLLLLITLFTIAGNLFSSPSELATSSLFIEGVLTAFGFLLLFVPTEYYTKPTLPPEPDIHILPAFTVEKFQPNENFQESKALIPQKNTKQPLRLSFVDYKEPPGSQMLDQETIQPANPQMRMRSTKTKRSTATTMLQF
jgi:hypothetical protein